MQLCLLLSSFSNFCCMLHAAAADSASSHDCRRCRWSATCWPVAGNKKPMSACIGSSRRCVALVSKMQACSFFSCFVLLRFSLSCTEATKRPSAQACHSPSRRCQSLNIFAAQSGREPLLRRFLQSSDFTKALLLSTRRRTVVRVWRLVKVEISTAFIAARWRVSMLLFYCCLLSLSRCLQPV